MDSQSTNYTNIHHLGRSLIEEDSSSFTTIQGFLTALDKQWEQISAELTQKEKSVGHLMQLWKECCSLRDQLNEALNNASQSVKPPSFVPCDSVQVSKLLENAKAGNDVLKSHRYEMDNYKQKCKELLEQLEAIEKFDKSGLVQASVEIQNKWKDTCSKVETQLLNLESQMVLWQQIEFNKEEVIAWAIEMCRCLDECINNFESKEKAQLILDRYRCELISYSEMKNDILKKIESLQKLNNNVEIPTLTSLKSVIQNHFEEVANLASKLEGCIKELGAEEEDVRKEQQQLSEWLRLMREAVSKCEDISADDETILQNYENCK
ncbi:Nesprin-1, partial [Stegodyphus mimosarum]